VRRVRGPYPTNGDNAPVEVTVIELQVDELAKADRGLGHQSDERPVAALALRKRLLTTLGAGHRAGRDDRAELTVGQ